MTRLYVGGLTATGNHAQIFESTVKLEKWQAYDTPVVFYALAVFNSQLTLVGGMKLDHGGKNVRPKSVTDEIWMSSNGASSNGASWQKQLPSMPTKRCFSSAVSTGNPQCLIVAGGNGYVNPPNAIFENVDGYGYGRPERDIGELSTVEIYRRDQWFSVLDLPKPCCHMKSVVHAQILYLMGGSEQELNIFSCNLDTLMRWSGSMTLGSIWSTSVAALTNACPVTFGEHLVTVGGLVESSALILGYFDCIQDWKEIGNLPVEVFDTAALELPSGEIIVIGGFSHSTRISKVYKSSVRGMCLCDFVLCAPGSTTKCVGYLII